ncbi:hypothetical protein ACU686_45345 [Yinghuangia aomiensis]
MLQTYGQPLVPADRLGALPPPDPRQVAAFIAAGLDAPGSRRGSHMTTPDPTPTSSRPPSWVRSRCGTASSRRPRSKAPPQTRWSPTR